MTGFCDHLNKAFRGRKFYRGVWYKLFWCPDCKMVLPIEDENQGPNKPG